jgi:hypothetical protein
MLKTVSRPPISRINAMVLASFAVGAVVAALLGGRMATVALLIGSAVGLAGALNARRPNARDVTRLNAMEYRDERDRLLAQQGLAVVGAAALILSVGALIVTTAFGDYDGFIRDLLSETAST